MNALEKPIIIVGTGRCGSTMLHRLLACHPDVGWLSTYNEVFPRQPWLSVFSNLYRSARLDSKIKHLPFFPKPFEAYRFWESYLPGFSRRDRPLTADDVSGAGADNARRAAARVLAYQKKQRLLVKVTGWSRIAYFNRIFPDAVFIFLEREHRAVISSWVKAGWLDVTSSPDSASWQWGAVPRDYLRAWKDLGGGPILSAAIKIQLDLDDIRANVDQFSSRCYGLQYENLIAQPQHYLREIAGFCGLRWDEGFARDMGSRRFYDTKDKWKNHLSERDGELIMEFFRRVDRRHALAQVQAV